MIKSLILVFSLLIIWFFSFNTSKIDGTYHVIYDKDNIRNVQAKYTITIIDTIYLMKQKGLVVEKGKINSFTSADSNLLYLTYDKEPLSINPLDSLLYKSFGKSIMELRVKNLDTIAFRTTYLANLHLTVNKGIMVRIK